MMNAVKMLVGVSVVCLAAGCRHGRSVRLLRTALATVPCALLLVSHDEYFLKRLARTRWRLVERGGTVELKIES